MTMTDPIADMLTRVRNAAAVRKAELSLPFSKIKYQLAQILEREGYVGSVEKIKDKFDLIRIQLKYDEKNKSLIGGIKRVSKPGRRVYVGYAELPHVLDGLGIAVISTPQGLMTNREARKKKIGGEVVCEIY